MSVDGLPELLTRVDFPLYTVNVFSPRHIIVGGGGGAAKTGVKNGFVRKDFESLFKSVCHFVLAANIRVVARWEADEG